MASRKNGKTPEGGDEQANEPVMTESSRAGQDDTVNIGNNDVWVEPRQSYQPTPNVLDAFTRFTPIPEEAWMKAGLSRRELARKRRIIANYNYILYGVTDVMGDQFIDLAGHAGLDDKAMSRAERVATHMPQPADAYGRFQQRMSPERNTPERR